MGTVSVYVCLCVYSVWACVYMCAHAYMRRPDEESSVLYRPSFYSLGTGLPLKLELGWQSSSPSDPPVSIPSTAGLEERMATPTSLLGCWELELRWSCLHSYPPIHPPSMEGSFCALWTI